MLVKFSYRCAYFSAQVRKGHIDFKKLSDKVFDGSIKTVQLGYLD